MAIKNFIFDVGNVLIRWDKSELPRLIFQDNEKERLLAEKHVFKNPDWYIGDLGNLSIPQFIDLLAKDMPQGKKYIAERAVYGFPEAVPMIEGPNDFAIKKAAEGYNVYLLTNFNQLFPEVLERMPVKNYITGFVCSSDIRVVKPDERIFEELIKKFGILPNESVFIDDSEANVAAATGLGFKAVRFTGDMGPLTHL